MNAQIRVESAQVFVPMDLVFVVFVSKAEFKSIKKILFSFENVMKNENYMKLFKNKIFDYSYSWMWKCHLRE